MRLHVLQKDRLVGKGIGGVAIEIIEAEQGIIKEAWWPGGRYHEGCPYLLDIAQRTRHFIFALLAAHGLDHLLRILIHHRIPDSAGELHEVSIIWTILCQ